MYVWNMVYLLGCIFFLKHCLLCCPFHASPLTDLEWLLVLSTFTCQWNKRCSLSKNREKSSLKRIMLSHKKSASIFIVRESRFNELKRMLAYTRLVWLRITKALTVKAQITLTIKKIEYKEWKARHQWQNLDMCLWWLMLRDILGLVNPRGASSPGNLS